MSEMTEAEITKRRLRWKCRRGMLELDLYLTEFFDKHYDKLNSDERQTFARLLEVDDTKLYAWFLKTESPDDPAFKSLVDAIVKA